MQETGGALRRATAAQRSVSTRCDLWWGGDLRLHMSDTPGMSQRAAECGYGRGILCDKNVSVLQQYDTVIKEVPEIRPG